jgi:hypothetical protein
MRGLRCFVIATVLAGVPAAVSAQVGVPLSSPLPTVVQQAPMPATRLESFQAEAGSVVTVGHEDLGAVARNRLSVDVRDLRDSRGSSAGGLTVFVNDTANSTRYERAFIDVDELPGLLRSLDTLLKFMANPTTFKRFEARFSTRGHLTFIAYTNSTGAIEYAVQAGRPLLATATNIDAVEMLKLRGLLELGLQKLNAAGYSAGM